MTADELKELIDQVWETVYDQGNGKYLGEKSKQQRALAFENLEALYQAIEAEREACAKLCEQSDRYRGDYFASIIRARSQA